MRIGAVQVKCAAVYGIPGNHPDAADLNQSLFLQVFQHLAASRLPVLLGEISIAIFRSCLFGGVLLIAAIKNFTLLCVTAQG